MEFEHVFYGLDGVLSALNFLPFTISIVTYVLTSLGLYTMAKRRMINHPWLSWVPVANMWILGSLSDQYRYVARGQVKNKRKVLLGLSIAQAVLTTGIVIALIAMGVNMVSGVVFEAVSEDTMIASMFGGIMGMMGLTVLVIPVGIAAMVFQFMALYDLYMSCDPENAVLFLVLSIVIRITQPFFIFCSRNREKGMPPRRPQPEQIPPYEAPRPEPVQVREESSPSSEEESGAAGDENL